MPQYTAGNGIDITDTTLSAKIASSNEIGAVKPDGQTIGVSASGTINIKRKQTIVLSDSSLEITSGDSTTVTVVEHVGDGALSVSTSSSSVATASISGNTITITSVGSGNCVITVTAASTAQWMEGTATVGVTVALASIYGAEWNGSSSSAWTRTDDAALFSDPNPYYRYMTGTPSSPFDNIMPWSGMQIVEDASAGTLVSIPKFYYKWTRNGSAMKLQISTSQHDGFLCSPAHADRGDNQGERNVVYVSRYHCATSTFKSTKGVKPAGNYTRAQFRASISNLGTDIWQYDFAMYWTIMMLYLVEFADWNSQAKIGCGCGNSSSIESMGYTDSMTYHTGTSESSRAYYGHTQYRHIEDLWGNVYDWVDGIYFSGSYIYCIKNPASFSDSTGGTNVGIRTGSNGYITAWTNPSVAGFEYALYSNSVGAYLDGSTYICDYCYYNSGVTMLFVGGFYYGDPTSGAFYLNGTYTASDKSATVGSRLMVLPPSRLTSN